mgnify:CR=1 FL=1
MGNLNLMEFSHNLYYVKSCISRAPLLYGILDWNICIMKNTPRIKIGFSTCFWMLLINWMICPNGDCNYLHSSLWRLCLRVYCLRESDILPRNTSHRAQISKYFASFQFPDKWFPLMREYRPEWVFLQFSLKSHR